MITLQECRDLLGDPVVGDEELEEVIEDVYAIARIMVEAHLRRCARVEGGESSLREGEEES